MVFFAGAVGADAIGHAVAALGVVADCGGEIIDADGVDAEFSRAYYCLLAAEEEEGCRVDVIGRCEGHCYSKALGCCEEEEDVEGEVCGLHCDCGGGVGMQ